MNHPDIQQAIDRAFEGPREWTDEDRESYLKSLWSEGEHFLFKSPERAEMEDKDTLEGLRAGGFEDVDEVIRAMEELKEKGNNAFRRGPKFYGNAMRHYKSALKHEHDVETSEELRNVLSTIHSNIGAVFLARKQYRDVIPACEHAQHLHPSNVKAAWRLGKALLQYGYYARAKHAAEIALATESGRGNGPLESLLAEADAGIAKVVSMREQVHNERRATVQQLRQVRRACHERGITIGKPMFRQMQRTPKDPYLDEQGCLHWPVVFLYPESSMSDYLEDVEEVAPIQSMLDVVLESPPLWDRSGKYWYNTVDVFFQTNQTTAESLDRAWWREENAYAERELMEEEGSATGEAATGAGAAEGGSGSSGAAAMTNEELTRQFAPKRWVRIPTNAPLLLPLVQDTFVVSDLPVFYIVARDTEFYHRMRDACGGTFPELSVPDLPAAPEETS